MFKPEELVPREVWTVVLSKLFTTDELSCRCVCVSFKKEVDSIFNKNKDRLWLRHRKNNYEHYFCHDKNHRISSRDTLYFGKKISTKMLKFVSKLMPSLKILQLDPFDRKIYYEWYDFDDNGLFDYRNKKGKAIAITKIFPQVACLILPGGTENKNFAGHLSQVKHLTLFQSVVGGPPGFPNLDSLELRILWNSLWDIYGNYLPMPCKRFVVPYVIIKWNTLPKTLEVIETALNFDEYISVGIPHFGNLKILKNNIWYTDNEELETLMNFLKDHKESLAELSFSVEEQVGNIKVLLPLLTRLQKLFAKIKTHKHAIELKEIKALAHNLHYFELSCCTIKNLGAILKNLPRGLDNLSIEGVKCHEEIKTFIEIIMGKVLNGDTKRVTIVGEYIDEYERNEMFSKIVKKKPELVRVEKKNTRICDEDYSDCGRCRYFSFVFDIVISL